MGKYLKEVEFKHTFDGEEVTARIEPIDFLDALVRREARHDNARFLGLLPGLLTKYVKDLRGVTDAQGQPVPLEVIATKAYFVELATALATAIAMTGVPRDPLVSAEPSGGSSATLPTSSETLAKAG